MISFRIFRIFICAGILCLLVAVPVRAATTVVTDFSELNTAVSSASPGDEIVMTDGVYTISGTWAVVVRTRNLTLRSQSGNRENVILRGFGMYANGHHGFYVDADSVTIRDLTVENVRNHCIQTAPDTDDLYVKNCILRDAGEQILKVPFDSNNPDPSERGIVEDCYLYYSASVGPRDYIGGIDVHRGTDWIVRDNVFRDIVTPSSSVAEHAIHFWNWSENTLSERNIIINCDRGIGYGLTSSSGHHGGIIRNNLIYHDSNTDGGSADVSIEVVYSDNTQVYNNTVYQGHDNYYAAIRMFGTATTGGQVHNNLLNMNDGFYGHIQDIIWWGSGATGVESHNIKDTPQPAWFQSTDPNGSLETFLHLDESDATVQSAILDQGMDIAGLIEDTDRDIRFSGRVDIGGDEIVDGVLLDVELWLQGFYSGGAMSDALSAGGFLQGRASPYDGTPAPAGIPSQTVDWIQVQLRATPAGPAVTGRSVYLRSDGQVTDLNGIESIVLDAPAGDYHVVVRHRNHLAVMSATTISLSTGSSAGYAFDALSHVYGQSGVTDLGGGVIGLCAGDIDRDGGITTTDYVDLYNARHTGATGYTAPAADLDGNGQVDEDDMTFWQQNAVVGEKTGMP